MTLGTDTLETTATLRDHLAGILSIGAVPLRTAIHPADEMLTYPMQVLGRGATEAVLEYFQVGNATFSLLGQVLQWLGTSWPQLGSVLDFASGYGRVARFVAAAGCARVCVADILAPAVAFQQQQFGVSGFVSGERPEQVDLGGPHDFISVISLFSHLPRATFAGWLARLTNALRPGGAMLFTTHGECAFAREGGRGLANDEFVFHRASESSQLDRSSYGTTFVHPTRVQRLLGELPGITLLGLVPHGLNEHQDVYIVGRHRLAPREPLQLVPVPKVCIDDARLRDGGKVAANGWALDGHRRQPVRSVALFAGAQPLGQAVLGGHRPDLETAFGSALAAAGGWQAGEHAPVVGADWFTALAEDGSGQRGFACQRLAAVHSPSAGDGRRSER